MELTGLELHHVNENELTQPIRKGTEMNNYFIENEAAGVAPEIVSASSAREALEKYADLCIMPQTVDSLIAKGFSVFSIKNGERSLFTGEIMSAHSVKLI